MKLEIPESLRIACFNPKCTGSYKKCINSDQTLESESSRPI